MDCFVGAQTGAIKGVCLRDNTFLNLIPIKTLLPKNDEITRMIWAGETQTEILTAQLDRQLKLFDSTISTHTPLFTAEGGKGAIKGLHLTPEENIITCVESGLATIWTKEGEEKRTIQVGENITTMRGCNEKQSILTGGTRNLIKTWDIETGKQKWGAKNVPLDKLQLEVPMFCVDAQFVPNTETIVEATKVHELRLYDPKAQRRPVKVISFMESPLTAMTFCHREHHVIAANSIGEMGLFDLRSRVHPVNKYKGQAGSIRSLDAHPTAPYLASCGIDRFVRVHDIDTKKLVHKIYCKTRMNSILLSKNLSILNVKKETTDDDWEKIKKEDDSDLDDESDESDECSEDDSGDSLWGEDDDAEIQTLRKTRSGQTKNSSVQRKRKEDVDEDIPKKKKKSEKGRKRKDSITDDSENDDDEDVEIIEPKKKAKLNLAEIEEIKEEVVSDDEPVPPKKKKLLKKK